VTFTVDGSRTASVACPADGHATSVEVTDAAGTVWRLEVPGDALAQPVTITITALANLSSATVPGAITGGVLLGPDGLRFLTPATLTAIPAAGTHPGLLLIGRHDGSGVELAASTQQTDRVSAQIFHFSLGASTSSDDAALAKLRQAALADFESAKAAAQELMGQAVTVPPPPDVKLHCMGTSAYQSPEAALAQYEKSVASPEDAIRERLLGAGRALGLLGEEAKSQEAIKLAADVSARVVKKTRTLVKTYAPQPDKFMAVSRVALNAARTYELLGGPADAATMTALADWAGKFLDHYIDELRVRHDYRVVPALVEVARIAGVLGAANAGDALDRIEAAMTFTAYFDTALSMSGANTLQWHVNGNVTLDKATDTWEGTANGKYVDFSSTNSDLQTMVMPNLFPVTVKILQLDACVNNTADLSVSAIGADSEVYVTSKGSVPATPGYIKSMAAGLMVEKLDPASAYSIYRFNMPLTNLDPEPAREVFTKGVGGVSFQYDLKLTHSPQ
jgi:hypothetical protein